MGGRWGGGEISGLGLKILSGTPQSPLNPTQVEDSISRGGGPVTLYVGSRVIRLRGQTLTPSLLLPSVILGKSQVPFTLNFSI